MSRANKTRISGKRLLKLVALNVSIGVAVGLALWLLQNRAAGQTLGQELVSSLIHSGFYGLLFGLPMPYFGERLAVIRPPWNWISIIFTLLLIAVVSTFLVEINLLYFGLLSVEGFREEYVFKSLSVFLIALVIGLGIYVYELFRDHFEATNLQLRIHELEKERALKLASEARLASLESKLHPHFLFNTLNSISALISEDPVLADKMVQRLASLLRNSLDAVEKNRVTLDDEIRLVTDYLEIEKTRFRDRLSYEFDIESGMADRQVPPMMLLPLIENSVKFAVTPDPDGAKIKISARRKNGLLIFEVTDDGPGFTSEMLPTGHGLDNLQSRLNNMYGDAANLSVRSCSGETVVVVTLTPDGLNQTP